MPDSAMPSTAGPQAADLARMPYQLAFPPEAATEIVVAPAQPRDERVWVPQMDDVWFRPLCLSVSHGYWVNLLRVRKSGVAIVIRHPCTAMFSSEAGTIWSTTGSPNQAATCSSRPARRTRWSCPITYPR